MAKKSGCGKGHIRFNNKCVKKTELFRPIKAKRGYKEMKDIGFFAYKSDGWGDWHRNSKIPGIAVTGDYKGYVIYKKSPSGYWSIPDSKLGGARNMIKRGDMTTLKRRIIEEA